ncbi:hypothetical protein ASD39_09580 [Sphingomonas sp. Root50]|nr:hypothetical protein ASD17_09520 [Sphingomonas sp. Root1294]KQY67370.1 hypothetical protein ASD39_09580 [Sphingomonas sp. Root50]KRB90748.1 hypothetical protein ASE22_10590 [Sphingomonas sp. Root720]
MVGLIAYMIPVMAVLKALEALGFQSAWLTTVVAMPFVLVLFYVAGQTGAWMSSILERIAGVEDDLTAFLRQVTYVDTGPDDGYWIDRSGRRYKSEAALMRGVDRFAKEREG